MSTKKLQIIGNLGGSSIKIDDTLTKSGQAADAKATGDALNQMQANIDEVAGLVGGSSVEHSHDDRYYTEAEIDSMMADINAAIDGKSDSDHAHDDLYYTETEIDDKLDAMQSNIDSKVDAVDGMGLSTNDYTTAEKDKLATVEANANFYEHPIHTSHSSGLYKVTVDGDGHVSGATLAEKEDIVALGIPAQDTTYDTEISDLNDRIDDVENSINTTNDTLNGISQELEAYKTTNNEAVSTNTSGIETNKDAIEVIQGDYLTSTDKIQLQDDITKVSDRVTANASAIEVLNGEGEGSVKQSIDNAFNEFAANVTNDEVVNTYKELIDYAATHNSEFVTLVGEVDTINTHVGEVETDLSNYKTEVSDRFAEFDTAVNDHISDANNPHDVTKEQIGLENVDNTADLDKPISNAVDDALRGKADLEHAHSDLYYDKDEIETLVTVEDIDEICGLNDPSGESISYVTEQWVRGNYQPKGDYLTIGKLPEAIDTALGYTPANAEDVTNEAVNYTNKQVKKAAPRNLLDNSYFCNPVNQLNRSGAYGGVKGKTTRFIDRWSVWSNLTSHTSTSDGVVATNNYTDSLGLMQTFEHHEKMLGKTYTAVICYDNDVIRYGKVTVPSTAGSSNYYRGFVSLGAGKVGMRFVLAKDLTSMYYEILIYAGETHTIKWTAVYEGDYTTGNLPTYQPKGYEYELLICRQYDPITDEYIGLKNFYQQYNILHNSDFSNPVNQRSKSSYTGIEYTIDRWRTWSEGKITVGNGYINTGSIALWQYIDPELIDLDAYYTGVLYKPDGTKIVYSGKPADGFGSWNQTLWVSYEETDGVKYPYFRIETGYTANVKAVGLYKGIFNSDSVPEYQPKGFGVELADCQRYYCNSWFGKNHHSQSQHVANVWQEGKTADAPLMFPVAMRIAEPTITLHNAHGRDGIKVYNAGSYYDIGTYSIQYRLGRYGAHVRISKGSSDTSTWSNGATIQFHAHWEASADW